MHFCWREYTLLFKMRASWEVMGNSTIFAGGVLGKRVLFPEWLPERGRPDPPRNCPGEVSSTRFLYHSAHCKDHSLVTFFCCTLNTEYHMCRDPFSLRQSGTTGHPLVQHTPLSVSGCSSSAGLGTPPLHLHLPPSLVGSLGNDLSWVPNGVQLGDGAQLYVHCVMTSCSADTLEPGTASPVQVWIHHPYRDLFEADPPESPRGFEWGAAWGRAITSIGGGRNWGICIL